MKTLFHPSLYEFDREHPSYRETSAGEPGRAPAGLRRQYLRLGDALHRLRGYLGR